MRPDATSPARAVMDSRPHLAQTHARMKALSARPILVTALNPAVDAEWRVGPIHWDEKNTVHSESRWAGGKGVNVARWLARLGGRPRLLIALGGATGAEMEAQLQAQQLALNVVRLAQATRVNLMVTPPRGPQLRFNPPGPRLSRTEWAEVVRQTRREQAQCGCQIFSGALPRAARPAMYRDLVRLGHEAGVRTLLDCDGPALVAGLTARPFLVKPNEHELAQWHGRPLRTTAAVLRAALAMSEQTRGWVLVSRAAHGALLVNAGEGFTVSAAAPAGKVLNTVGAGDALVAAVARQWQLGTAPEAWLRWGVAAGTAAAQTPAGRVASLAAVRRLAARIRVRRG